jgi:hypothetical protein
MIILELKIVIPLNLVKHDTFKGGKKDKKKNEK